MKYVLIWCDIRYDILYYVMLYYIILYYIILYYIILYYIGCSQAVFRYFLDCLWLKRTTRLFYYSASETNILEWWKGYLCKLFEAVIGDDQLICSKIFKGVFFWNVFARSRAYVYLFLLSATTSVTCMTHLKIFFLLYHREFLELSIQLLRKV